MRLTKEQLVLLYQSRKSNISEHIKHIIGEGELDESSTVRKFRIVQKEGDREVVRNFRITASVCRNFRQTAKNGKIYNGIHYNLDMIIATCFLLPFAVFYLHPFNIFSK